MEAKAGHSSERQGMMLPLLAVSLWTIPVAGALVADQITTQQGLRMGYVERNPLPGMHTLPGRIAWHSVEFGAIGWALHSKHPGWRRAGKLAAVASILAHGTAAVLNSRRTRR